MNIVLGTKGYNDAIEEFADVSFSLKFTDIDAEFLPLFCRTFIDI